MAAAAPLVRDRFEDDRPPGAVVGSTSTGGAPRHVIDVEGRVSIDRAALRFAPIRVAGWGRQGISYGPTAARSGLVFDVTILGGHNGSHSGGIDGGLRRRFKDWLLGPRDRNPVRRLVDLARSPRRAESWWLWKLWLSRWWRARSDPSVIGDNLAVGWFDRPAPTDPLAQGHCLVMRTNEAETGRLVASVRGGGIDVVPVVLNVPTSFVIVVGEFGSTYLASSLPSVPGFGESPALRPLAVDRTVPPDGPGRRHPGVHQSVLGQVGFSADTRIRHADVDDVPAWSNWWTTAHRADELLGDGPIEATSDEVGDAPWRSEGSATLHRSPTGLRMVEPAPAGSGLALVPMEGSCGLVAAWGTVSEPADRIGLVVRADGTGSRLVFEVGAAGARLVRVSSDSSVEVLAEDDGIGAEPGAESLLQVSDDGEVLTAHLDDRPLVTALRLPESTNGAGLVGLAVAGSGARLRRFEAHLRSIDRPGPVEVPELPLPTATTVVLDDDFSHPPGDLVGRSPAPGVTWRRATGTGVFATVGWRPGAAVDASPDAPGPNRTIYLLPLTRSTAPGGGPPVAEIDMVVTPPGSGRGHGQRGRAGVVFWQDADHHVMVSNWLDDTYPGASLSLFCRLGPVEDVFRAVWSNVGERIDWGVPHRLRVGFDGSVLAAHIDDELVLYRSVADVHPDIDRIEIEEVGMVANWEWGTDTGSTIDRFVVRSDR